MLKEKKTLFSVLTFCTLDKKKLPDNKKLMDKIKLEKQEELLLQTEGKTKEENEQMLKKKGIWTYLEDIDEGLLDGRLLSGYISKERKENLGLDTLGALTKISGLNMMTKVAGINMNSKYA